MLSGPLAVAVTITVLFLALKMGLGGQMPLTTLQIVTFYAIIATMENILGSAVAIAIMHSSSVAF